MNDDTTKSVTRTTQTLLVDPSQIAKVVRLKDEAGRFAVLDITADDGGLDMQYLKLAAEKLKHSNVPVAFPTETVYGLGADATRSEAVQGIYTAKQRPSDNPLIVHFSSPSELDALLGAGTSSLNARNMIPPIYDSLIQRFWPGPLTIILPIPENSPLAPEVTAGLNTFGARIPRSLLALALIKLAGRPIAAPSANASTKPSPTAAEHVKEDLDGRIEYIIDGGPCDVGVESTVVDGLSSPPAILRPGGISVDQLRECPGWEDVVVGYEDVSLENGAPRAPGMKYRHYSPKAKVILYEAGSPCPNYGANEATTIGVVKTRKWKRSLNGYTNGRPVNAIVADESTTSPVLSSIIPVARPELHEAVMRNAERQASLWELELGDSATDVARDLFWALRELDRKGCDVIHVEGISSDEGDIAAAVMNRLRKAAEVHINS